jgi:hypothetical protein
MESTMIDSLLIDATLFTESHKAYKVVLNFDVIANGQATTECQSMLDALAVDLGSELTSDLSILKCYSSHSDHANAADKTSTLFGEAKQKSWEGISEHDKTEMNAHDLKIATVFKKRHCGQHLVNILSSSYIGSHLKSGNDDAHPDKSQMTHGRVEYSVLARLCAAHIIGRHVDISAGRRALQLSPHSSIDLLRWGFQRMQAHWHKCPHNKDPKPFNPDSIPSVSGGMFSGS